MKAILVIETDAKHIEDLYVETIWNDYVLVDLGKEYHFKPMPQKISPMEIYRNVVRELGTSKNVDIPNEDFCDGWNYCLDEIMGDEE